MRRLSSLTLAASALALACAAEVPDVGAPPGAIRGELAAYVADRLDGTSETRYALRLEGGGQQRLSFPRDPGLVTGAAIVVWGTPGAGGSLRVDGYRVLDAGLSVVDERKTSALLAGTPLPARSFAFVLLDMGNGVNLSKTQATQEMFDASFFSVGRGSIRRYYQEASYGLQDITGAVIGPIAFSPATSCDTEGAIALRAQVDAMVGATSDNYLWYFGSFQSGCDWSGLASLGSPASPTKDTWYNASANCVVFAQEPGHNFGMQHSSSMRCPLSQTFVDAPDGACAHSEYGDLFDPMGNGCFHMNGWQKQYQGWLGGCNSVRVSASGTFTLLPLELRCDGIQVLQIPMPHTRTFSYAGGFTPGTTTDELTYYYVELRSPSGFDQGLAAQVQVRVGGDYRTHSQIGLHTWLLDMNPATATFADAAMSTGQTFYDPAGGVSITATAVSASAATITVQIDNGSGAPVCLDGTPLTPPGPASCTGADTGTGGTAGTGAGGDPQGGGGAGGATGGAAGSTGGSTSGGGCGCSLPGTGSAPRWSLVLAVLSGALGLRRSRPGRLRGAPRRAVRSA
jgi:MYXO-CTERM domain-containing protein